MHIDGSSGVQPRIQRHVQQSAQPHTQPHTQLRTQRRTPPHPHPRANWAPSRRPLGALGWTPLLAAAWLFCGAAQADGHRLQPRTALPVYAQECASCHLAYPPGLLPAASWSRLMNTLDRHYGTDATLDPATVQQISTWLSANAGTGARMATPPPEHRITRSAWFERKHRRIHPQVWTHAAVKSAANCAACHTRADQGDYDDDRVSAPPSLPPRLRGGWAD